MAQPHLKLVKHFFSLIQKGRCRGRVSPLFFAAREGHLEVCKVLVAEGADANQKSGDGDSPWFEACKKGHLDI
uniref:ANK_REP_REGION domain-containing protein n=1 Tax=Globodera pallida TaxID=36090 RepID=A0A183CRZ9_GLOPA